MGLIRSLTFLLQALVISVAFSTSVLKAQNAVLLNTYEFEKKMDSLDDYQLVDVRTSEEFKKGHLRNALNLDFSDSSFSELLDILDKDKPLFVYCKTGNRSAKAAAKMVETGFKNVYDLQGGITAWKNAGKETVSEGSKTANDKFTSRDLRKIISSKNVVLVDFYATWCIPCMKMRPAIDTLSKQFEVKAVITSVNVEYAKALTKELGIREIPVVNAYKSGELVATYTGYVSESRLRTIIKNLLH